MRDWEYKFNEIILRRGLDYYLDDSVRIIEKDEELVRTLVRGSSNHDYQVKIKFTNHRMSDASCTCPYARENEYCKHMAAVLYALDEKIGQPRTDKENDHEPVDSLQDIVSGMSEADAKKLLLAEAENNLDLCSYIRHIYGKGGINIVRLKQEATDIGYRHADRHGFIDYYHAADFVRDSEISLEKYLRYMMDTQKYNSAFALVCHTFCSLSSLEIDDSGGEIGILVDVCSGYWKEIIEECGLDEQWKFFEWFRGHQYNFVVDYLQCYIEDFFMENFHEPEMLQQKLDTFDQLIAEISLNNKAGSSDFSFKEYALDRYTSARLRIIEELEQAQTLTN